MSAWAVGAAPAPSGKVLHFAPLVGMGDKNAGSYG